MPIKGKVLYPFRWWFRATLANSAAIPQTAEMAETALISATSSPLGETLPIASKK